MANLLDLPALLADLTERQRTTPASRNRAIAIYVVNNETVTLTDSFSSTTFSPPFLWYDGSTGSYPEAIWGQFEWQA